MKEKLEQPDVPQYDEIRQGLHLDHYSSPVAAESALTRSLEGLRTGSLDLRNEPELEAGVVVGLSEKLGRPLESFGVSEEELRELVRQGNRTLAQLWLTAAFQDDIFLPGEAYQFKGRVYEYLARGRATPEDITSSLDTITAAHRQVNRRVGIIFVTHARELYSSNIDSFSMSMLSQYVDDVWMAAREADCPLKEFGTSAEELSTMSRQARRGLVGRILGVAVRNSLKTSAPSR